MFINLAQQKLIDLMMIVCQFSESRSLHPLNTAMHMTFKVVFSWMHILHMFEIHD